MKISVKETGGFSGISINRGVVNTLQLDPGHAEQIQRLVSDLDFFHLAPTVSDGTSPLDLSEYEITISEGQKKHTVTFRNGSGLVSQNLHTLVETVSQLH
jgi:archaellin